MFCLFNKLQTSDVERQNIHPSIDVTGVPTRNLCIINTEFLAPDNLAHHAITTAEITDFSLYSPMPSHFFFKKWKIDVKIENENENENRLMC